MWKMLRIVILSTFFFLAMACGLQLQAIAGIEQGTFMVA